MPNLKEQAERLKALHVPGDPLVLVNVWDAVSAKIVEGLGAKAIATSSAALSWSRGFPDEERISRQEMLAGVQIVTDAVALPVTADLERGYGAANEDAAATAYGAIDAGAVGLNFEDWSGESLADAESHADRIAAMVAAGKERGIELVINARTDVYLRSIGENDAWRFAETVRRSNRYLRAGAVCAFVPGLADEAAIEKLVKSIDGPVSFLAREDAPNVKRFAELGAARVSIGGSGMTQALYHYRELARAIIERGDFSMLAQRIPHNDIDALFRR